MSAAIGFALSIGLVWWERANNLSIKDLGPIAVGFAILLLAFVMYQSVRMVGGSWAGAGITIGASIIIAQLLGIPVLIDPQIIQTIIVVALIFGLLAFMSHRHHLQPRVRLSGPKLPDIKRTMADLYRQRHMSKGLDHGLRRLRKEAKTLQERPEEGGDILRQIKRMLPAQGYPSKTQLGSGCVPTDSAEEANFIWGLNVVITTVLTLSEVQRLLRQLSSPQNSSKSNQPILSRYEHDPNLSYRVFPYP